MCRSAPHSHFDRFPNERNNLHRRDTVIELASRMEFQIFINNAVSLSAVYFDASSIAVVRYVMHRIKGYNAITT